MLIAQNLIVPHPEGSFSLLLTFSLSTYVLDLASCDQQIKTSIILAGCFKIASTNPEAKDANQIASDLEEKFPHLDVTGFLKYPPCILKWS